MISVIRSGMSAALSDLDVTSNNIANAGTTGYKKRETSFRLVACNSTSRRDGRPLQELGFYNPRTKETRLDTEALRTRLGQGAQPTDAVRTLLEKGGILEKKVRPAEVLGKQKQEKERSAKKKDAAASETSE